MKIDFNSPLSLPAQVKEKILARIESSIYKPDERIPSEENLAREFGVSRMTVRQAIVEMIGEKKLYRIPGRGTFVSGSYFKETLNEASQKFVMLVVPNLRHSFYYQIISGLESTLAKNSFNVLLRSVNEDFHEEKTCLNNVLKYSVSGLVLIAGKYSSSNLDLIEKIRQRIPVVCIDVRVIGAKTDFVASDDRKGGFMVTEHLIELGHKNILHLAGPEGDSSAEFRCNGYMEALKSYGIKIKKELIRYTDWHFEEGYFETKKFFLNGARATAVFACNDEVAAGAYKALKDLKITVPDEVALAGYGNLDIGKFFEVPLTTVDQGANEMGKVAARILLERIRNKNTSEAREVMVPTKLIVRDSCGIRKKESVANAIEESQSRR